ncbi:hypothetical protein RvY_14022 [Ramazzottius varieornatus]|uniref:Kinesin motor domain-containing protein n=1 Tax=Ramazzottius varieornatus TaxID=947166 RepID=A0A1D1VRZ6_RAMVA|nr:hypothetical protein RvY_14022 [Ramazzottius varieornatus]
MAAPSAAIPLSAKPGPNPPPPPSASALPKTNAPPSVLNATENAHAVKSEAGKGHKDGLKGSKDNVKGPVEEVAKSTTDNHSHGFRSLSPSSGHSKVAVRRCLSKVMRNIAAASDCPLRIRKPRVSRRLLPPAPNPHRTKINPAKNPNVRLICRIQPTTYYASDRIIIHPGNQVLEVLQPSKLNAGESSRWMFNFKRVFYGGTQEEVFQETLVPALDRALEGVNSLVLLCGRKGTGKTYTSCGEDANFDYRGMIPRALHKVFEEIGNRRHELDIRVSISYFDLVGERMMDLLRERFVDVMTECTYHNLAYVKELAYARPTNEEEALIIYFLIHSKNLTEEIFTVSKLTFLELGSTTNLRDFARVLPGTHNVLLTVNKSISLLEKAVSMKLTGQLAVDKIPCRQSKLVYALKDILTSEKSLLTVLVCISGEAENLEQSISSLRFSSRFKGILVRPVPNGQVDNVAAYRKKVEEANMLRTELRMYDLLNSRESAEYALHTGAQDYFRSARDVRDYMDGRMAMPKFSTYKQLENFLQLMKKFAK